MLAQTDTTIGEITVFTARKIITMTHAMPTAEAVAVADGKIVAVGTLPSLKPWLDRHAHQIDDRFADQVIMPGMIDPHVHPTLPAVVTQFPFLAPDDWSLPTGMFPGALTPSAYISRLKQLVAEHRDANVPFICWGYHPLWHGEHYRRDLSALFPDRPVILWHRSFHELVCNDGALAWLGLTEADVRGRAHMDWDRGHFAETGAQTVALKLAPLLFHPQRFGAGIATFIKMLHRAGVTTCLDMGVGVFGNPLGEIELIRKTADALNAPLRIIITPTTVDFWNRKLKPIEALAQAEAWASSNSRRVMLDRHFKLQVDGAIFSGLSQQGFPGYLDGHAGMWMAPPESLFDYAEVFWKAGYQLHAHINGDLSTDLYLDFVRRLQDIKPRFDHRTVLEHFASTSEDQCRQMKALGLLVSANPYYVHLLSDLFGQEMLGPERAAQMVRLGSLQRLGVPFALHSDCPMAPLSPLTLAWAAATRQTINGNIACAQERISLEAALRAVTIDAAWLLRRETDIGSIRAGKSADFAVLGQDPFEVGIEGLKDIPIWGTVFEGEVHQVSGR